MIRRPAILLGGLAVVAFVMSLVLASQLFPHFSSNNDEPIYVLQAQAMRHGHLTLSATAHDDFFRPWMSGREGDHLFLVVQPVLPALLAASDLLFGSMRIALAGIAAGAVIAMFFAVRELLEDDRVALTAAALFTLSPLVVFQSALYLTYVLAVALTAVVITLVSQGLKRTSKRRLAVAGLVHGVLLFARPIEGLMLAVVLFLWVGSREGVARFFRAAVVMAVGALPVLALMLAYNRATTGDPIRFPLWAIGGNDSFGFGDRSIAPGAPVVHYGLAEAWLTLRTNLRAFPHWLFGGIVTVPLASYGAHVLWKKNRNSFLLVAAIAIIYPLGYFFYWGNYLIIAGRNLIGPHYYLALLIPASTVLAVGVVELVRRKPACLLVLVPALLVGTAIEVRDKNDANTRNRDFVEHEVATVDAAVHDSAVVVVPRSADGAWILHPRGEFGNAPDLSDKVLFAADLLGRNTELFDRFPDRTIYRFQELQRDDARHPDVERLQRMRTAAVDIDMTVTAAKGQPAVLAYVYVDGRSAVCALASDASEGARFHTTVRMTATTIDILGCPSGSATTAAPTDAAVIAIGAQEGSSLDLGAGMQVEQRYWVRPSANQIEVVAPADTWRKAEAASDFTVIDPTDAGFVAFHSF